MNCENCTQIHDGLYGSGRFCSKKCARCFSTKNKRDEINKTVSLKMLGRKLSEDHKLKISINNGNFWLNKKRNFSLEVLEKKKEKQNITFNKTYNKNKDLIRTDKNCIKCNSYNVKYFNLICDNCKIMYYKCYLPLCKFNFNVYRFKEYFDFELLEKFGWYKPTNRGNNIGGVSKDHLYSIYDGFKNNIDPEIIKHPANCRLILNSENCSKNKKSIISLEELLNKIKEFNIKYNYRE